MIPFLPRHLATVNIDVSSSNQRVQIAACGPQTVRVMNNGTATVWIEFGGSAVTAATATCMPIGPGGTEVLSANIDGAAGGALYAAAIAAGSTGKIYFTCGDGF